MKKIIIVVITGFISFFINFYALLFGLCNHGQVGCIPQSLVVWHTNFYSPAGFCSTSGFCPASFSIYMLVVDIIIWIVLSSILFLIIKKTKASN
jgi:hypothetical protein